MSWQIYVTNICVICRHCRIRISYYELSSKEKAQAQFHVFFLHQQYNADKEHQRDTDKHRQEGRLPRHYLDVWFNHWIYTPVWTKQWRYTNKWHIRNRVSRLLAHHHLLNPLRIMTLSLEMKPSGEQQSPEPEQGAHGQDVHEHCQKTSNQKPDRIFGSIGNKLVDR